MEECSLIYWPDPDRDRAVTTTEGGLHQTGFFGDCRRVGTVGVLFERVGDAIVIGG